MTDDVSQSGLLKANKDRVDFSGHGDALGAQGVRTGFDFLSLPGEHFAISPPVGGFADISIGCAWDPVRKQDSSFFGKLFKRTITRKVDLDLGCLFEMQSGHRGALQALGSQHGHYHEPPFITLSQDERAGKKDGDDETLVINGRSWSEIKRILIYTYIYTGDIDWAQIRPRITVRVPDNKPLIIRPKNQAKNLRLCVIASLENIRDGISFKAEGEFFNGHAEMDRAFGYGLEWDDGKKAGAA